MQEHRSKDAKNALATPLASHMAMPSSFPQPGEPWPREDRTLGSTGLDLRLRKVVQLVDVVAAMNWVIFQSSETQREKVVELFLSCL